MDSMSYFEIGGHIVQCNSTSIPSSSLSPSSFRGAPTQSRSGGATAAESINSGGRKGEHLDAGVEVFFALKGARSAFTIAAGLALADGPLPIGDALAIGVLVGYGFYEIYNSASIIGKMMN